MEEPGSMTLSWINITLRQACCSRQATLQTRRGPCLRDSSPKAGTGSCFCAVSWAENDVIPAASQTAPLVWEEIDPATRYRHPVLAEANSSWLDRRF